MGQETELLQEDEVQHAADTCGRVLQEMGEVLFGKPELIRLTFATILAGGHALLEGLPGLGKTVLARSFSSALGLKFRRVQFTPDLLPSDITGSYMMEEGQGGREMTFYPGPVFCNLMLADEINRASPKTQSALLEAMSEGQVTQFGERMPLEEPFCVLATQNPIELEGTYPLPEAQIDRFAVKLEVEGTGEDVLKRIITERKDAQPEEPPAVTDREELLELQETASDIYLPEAVADHISAVVTMTHPDEETAPEEVEDTVKYGASPRAAIWLTQISRALALMDGRPGVGFEDVERAAPAVLGHRIILHHGARLDGWSGRGLASRIVAANREEILSA